MILWSMLKAFARAYGRRLGQFAASQTAWVAIPALIAVLLLGLLELYQRGVNVSTILAPVMLPIR